MKIFKNRLILAILSLIMAFVLMFLILPMIQNQSSKTIEIVRVSNNILKGQKITSDKLTTETVGSYNLPADVLLDANDVKDKYAVTDLHAGDYILKSKVTEDISSSEQKLSMLNGKYYAVSFTVPKISASVSDKIKAGDIVSIIVTNKEDKSYIPTELTYVEIIATTNTAGVDVDERDNTDENENIAINITVYATKEQALKIAELENTSAVIHTALVYRTGDESVKNKYINTQYEVLEKLVKEDKE